MSLIKEAEVVKDFEEEALLEGVITLARMNKAINLKIVGITSTRVANLEATLEEETTLEVGLTLKEEDPQSSLVNSFIVIK